MDHGGDPRPRSGSGRVHHRPVNRGWTPERPVGNDGAGDGHDGWRPRRDDGPGHDGPAALPRATGAVRQAAQDHGRAGQADDGSVPPDDGNHHEAGGTEAVRRTTQDISTSPRMVPRGLACPPPHPILSPTVGRGEGEGDEETFHVRWWKTILVLGAIGGVVTLLAYGFTTDPRAIPSILTGKPAPDFSLTLFDGRTVRLSDFRGKVVFLNFWASWCPPCRAEARMLEQAWQRYKDPGMVFLGVDIQDTEGAARGFIRDFGISYMNGRAAKSRIAIDYGVYGIPETFFIDKEGRITYKHIGGLGWETVVAKHGEAAQGLASTEGKSGDYQSISVR